MARTQQKRVLNNFSSGLISEAGPLSVIENGFIACDNVEIHRDGSVSTRLPFSELEDTEAHTSVENLVTVGSSCSMIRQFFWREKGLLFLTTASSSEVWFQVFDSNRNIIKTLGKIWNDVTNIQYTYNGDEVFILVNWGNGVQFSRLVYNWSDNTFTTVSIASSNGAIFYRDFEGLPNYKYNSTTTNDSNVRTGRISWYNLYNLRNSGWDDNLVKCSLNEDGTDVTTVNPLLYTRSSVSLFPSLTDDISFGISDSASSPKAIGAYSPWYLFKSTELSRRIGKSGSSKLKLGLEGSSRSSNAEYSPADYDPVNPEVTEYPASPNWLSSSESSSAVITAHRCIGSRMWYGISGRSFNIMCSQVKGSGRDGIWYNNCYQQEDPTSPDNAGLLETDGAVFTISESGKVLSIRAFSSSIICFCENGVWEISGKDGYFSPSSFYIRKLTSYAITDDVFISETAAGLLYIADDTINIISTNTVGDIVSQPISIGKIKKEVRDLFENTSAASTIYDPKENKVFFCSGLGRTNKVDDDIYVLVFDLSLNCFYTWTIKCSNDTYDTSVPYPDGSDHKVPLTMVESPDGIELLAIAGAYNNSGGVMSLYRFFDTTSSQYYNFFSQQDLLAVDQEYLVRKPRVDMGGTFGNGSTTPMKPYDSFIKLPYDFADDFSTNKIAESINVVMKNTVYNNVYAPTNSAFSSPSSNLEYYWNWKPSEVKTSDLLGNFKYPYQESYNLSEVIENLVKVSGRGKSLSMKVMSSEYLYTDLSDAVRDHGFHLLGYIVNYSGSRSV